jgi:hypothetical protein
MVQMRIRIKTILMVQMVQVTRSITCIHAWIMNSWYTKPKIIIALSHSVGRSSTYVYIALLLLSLSLSLSHIHTHKHTHTHTHTIVETPSLDLSFYPTQSQIPLVESKRRSQSTFPPRQISFPLEFIEQACYSWACGNPKAARVTRI